MLQDNWTRKILKKKTSAKGQPRVGQEEEAVWSSYLIISSNAVSLSRNGAFGKILIILLFLMPCPAPLSVANRF